MTVDAPSHRERFILPHPHHALDRPVTVLATHLSGRHMLRVIEVNKIGQIVHLHPLDRLTLVQRRFDFGDFRRILADVAVAIHAHRCRRNARVTTLFRAEVAVEAGQGVVAGMHLVREGDRLIRLITLVVADLTQAGYGGNGRDNDAHGYDQNDGARFHAFIAADSAADLRILASVEPNVERDVDYVERRHPVKERDRIAVPRDHPTD